MSHEPDNLKTRISTAIVDDHYVVRMGLRSMLEQSTRIVLTAEYENGREFLKRLPESAMVDVLLLDIRMADVSGFDLLESVIALDSPPKVIFLTTYAEESYARQALKAGAKGYLTKDSSLTVIEEAAIAVQNGGIYISKQMQNMLFSDSRITGDKADKRWELTPESLSRPERVVLKGLVTGQPLKEIAFSLGVSLKTVSMHKRQLMKQLKAASIPELLAVVRTWDLTL